MFLNVKNLAVQKPIYRLSEVSQNVMEACSSDPANARNLVRLELCK